MTLRDFWRFHFLKALLGLVVIQLIIVAIVQNYNHRPEANCDELSMIQDRTLKVKPLMNDTDKDEESELHIQAIKQPINGVAEHKGKLVLYTPSPGFTGMDSMAYTLSDGKKESKMAYMVINVKANLMPLGNRDKGMIYTNKSMAINVLSNDEDREGDSIFIESFTQGQQGLVIMENGVLFYKSSFKAVVDSFSYVLSDGKTNTEPVSVVVDVKSRQESSYPWYFGDVGNVEQDGKATFTGSKVSIEMSGSDIWDNRDGMHFVYQAIRGNCEIITKVESLEANNEWAKAGLMFRESLSGGAANFYAGITTEHGVGVQSRYDSAEGTSGLGGKEGVESPYWLKLKREGNKCTAYCSADAKNWEQLNETELSLSKTYYVGMCATSHNNAELGKATFSNFSIKQ